MTDAKLFLKIKDNNPLAFQQFYNKYYQRLLSYIITFTKDRDQAKDIVQEAFVILWTNRESIDTSKSPKSYIFFVARNIFIDHYRKEKRDLQFLIELKETALSEQIENDSEEIKQRIEKMKRMIENLPEKCKIILKLSKIEGLNYQEIANHLNISPKTVESQMRIAFNKIREQFSEEDLIFFFSFYKSVHFN
ncbi:RNA polymerase sigma-70 factor [Salegentibacter mishustinae]|uniref:RNA polymerase sigma factor n=1 Tax=Salegentibacter mishustinae TaxID=270918 RepID=UPI001CE1B366|nr:RNA polymerase sigma-70 factor [Salegentibacter mishustinae]UBZ05610.1 RNA polymerase sigma-70 factor [Salegentibacter mishustinae]